MKQPTQALITGGQGELAQALAQALSAAGMQVVSPGRNEMDVTDAESVNDFVESLGSLELLVCNAAITRDSLLLKMDEENWDAVIDTNLRGSFLVARAAAKTMVKRRAGHIIFISSHSAYHPPLGQANYAASKAALDGLAKSMAQELGGRNIRVNVIVPGFMETKMTTDLPSAICDSVREKHTLKRFNQVEQAAAFISFIHQHMPHTSAQVFHLDSRIV